MSELLKLNRMVMEAQHFGWTKAELEELPPEERQWLTVEPAPRAYPKLYTEALEQIDSLSMRSPNTTNVLDLPTPTTFLPNKNGEVVARYNMQYPSPIHEARKIIGTDEDVAFHHLKNSVEPEYADVLGVEMIIRPAGGEPDPISKRTLLMVKMQGRACLSQLLVPSEEDRKKMGSNAQLTVDLAGHTLGTQAHAGSTLGHKIGQQAKQGDYVTYDWRIGGHVMGYPWDGKSYSDHELWLPLDHDLDDPFRHYGEKYDSRGNFDTRGQRMEPDEPYDPSRYPRVSRDTERAVLKALQTAEPYLDPAANADFFPPLVF